MTTWVVKVTLEAVGMTKCDHSLGLPDDQPISWSAVRMSRVSEANPQDATPLIFESRIKRSRGAEPIRSLASWAPNKRRRVFVFTAAYAGLRWG